MTYLIIGASSGLGRQLAEKFASEKNNLIIISSDLRDLIALQSDLQIRFDIKVIALEMDFQNPLEFEELDKIISQSEKLDGILLPIGLSDPPDEPSSDVEKIIKLFNINLVYVCTFINHYLKVLKKNKSVIIGFGSISAARGRGRNSTYAAAKRGLESYFESLRHHMQNTPIIIQFYILGYLDTNLTFGETIIGFKPANTKLLAEKIYNDRFDDFGGKVYPLVWKPVITILRFLPWFVFKKIKF